MKRFLVLFAFLFAHHVGHAQSQSQLLSLSDGEVASRTFDNARPSAVVLPYRVIITDINEYDDRDKKDRDKNSRDRRDHSGYNSRDSLDEDEIGEAVARTVADAVRRANRFSVREARPANDWYTAAVGESNRSSPRASDFLLGGRLNDVTVTTRRQRSKDKDSWAVEVSMLVEHEARTEDGELWRNASTRESVSRTFSRRPYNSALEDMIAEAGSKSSYKWARLLVIEKSGQIIAREGNKLTIDLGKRDGVGTDTDFVFQRAAENANADTWLNVAARPDAKHPEVFAVVGHPSRVEETYCVVELGYNGSGGFFGPDIKWKQRDAFITAVRDDDVAVLTARPFNAK